MLEKTGAVVITEEELIEAKAGSLPKRLEKTWGLTLDELSAIISSGNYRTVTQSRCEPLGYTVSVSEVQKHFNSLI